MSNYTRLAILLQLDYLPTKSRIDTQESGSIRDDVHEGGVFGYVVLPERADHCMSPRATSPLVKSPQSAGRGKAAG